MMKKILLLTIGLAILTWIHTEGAAGTDDPKAREIMEKVEDRDTGDNMTAQMEMVLIDKKNNLRIRKIHIFSKDKGEDTYKLMFFIHPADVKDTGFLNFDYDDPDRDDDQWLYLPALKKTKRIATSDKSGSFMGSDLNYSDMTSRDIEDFDFSFYKTEETEVDGHKCWLIIATPRSKEVIDETGYKQFLVFVRQDNYFVIRSVMWEERGTHKKFLEVKKLDLIEGIWVASETHVARKKGKITVHRTELKLSNVNFNQELTLDVFSLRRLEKGL
jgi:hypothetical protein